MAQDYILRLVDQIALMLAELLRLPKSQQSERLATICLFRISLTLRASMPRGRFEQALTSSGSVPVEVEPSASVRTAFRPMAARRESASSSATTHPNEPEAYHAS